jgi:hypothetical protein
MLNRICVVMLMGLFGAACLTGCGSVATDPLISASAQSGGPIDMQVTSAQNEDPFAAGQAAAQALRTAMADNPPHVVIMVECFDGKALKQEALKGVTSVFPKDTVFGFTTYGSFTQAGCLDQDSVALLGIGGDGIGVAAVLKQDLGIAGLSMETDESVIKGRLNAAGTELAQALPRSDQNKLVMLMADAHSPKNQFLVEGVQAEMGKDFPITGGSANKNAGQTYIYYRGQMFEDSAVAFMLSGDFSLAMTGRQAKDNDRVITTAGDGATEALKDLDVKPFAMLAFNCAGRMGRLDNIEDELTAMQASLGKDIPLFGCYCAGEIGPADQTESQAGVLSSGVGWHVMFTALGRK